MRRPLALVLALLILAAVAAPAEAATVHRTFVASVGTGGVSGTVRIAANTDGTGQVTYALKSLRHGATYRVEIRRGRCANLGSVAARITGVTASSSGVVNLTRGVSAASTYKIWSTNWSTLLAVRLVSGSSIRCGNLNFTRATRVAIPRQGSMGASINLAIVRSPNAYPYCNVAMYMGALNQPTEPATGATFIFAHARKGMFLPLLTAWRAFKAGKGASMVGMIAYVWTSNNQRHTYRVYSVRQSNDVQAAVGEAPDRLWLQTSTGPNYTYPKLVLRAERIATEPSSYASAHPTAKIVKCR